MKAITIKEAKAFYGIVDKEDFHLHRDHIIKLVNEEIIRKWDQLSSESFVHHTICFHIDLPPDEAMLTEISNEFKANGIIVRFWYCFWIQVEVCLAKFEEEEKARKKREYDTFSKEHGLDKISKPKKKWFQKILS